MDNNDGRSTENIGVEPFATELEDAPVLEGWIVEDSHARPWMYGWFWGHPEIADGDHAHTAPIVEMDRRSPPRWMRTESRVYRLGTSYPPSEREVRYWTQKLRQRLAMPVGRVPGGGDDIEAMLAFLRQQRVFKAAKFARLEEAYRKEQG